MPSALGRGLTPVWVDRDGTARLIAPDWQVRGEPTWSSLALSPDGTQLALSFLGSEGSYDLWVKQLDTEPGPLSRLTFEGALNRRATWSPDGRSLTFISDRAGSQAVWRMRADVGGTAEPMLDRDQNIPEAFYSPDGTWLVFRERENNLGAADIYATRPGVDTAAIALRATESIEYSPTLSPNGRWLAYVSDASGPEEVYVVPFPEVNSGQSQVSANGGVDPVWAHSGQELFYRNGANELVAVQVSEGSSFAWDRQDVLFSMADYLPSNGSPMYDVSPDDQEFVMFRIEDGGT